MIRKYVLAIVAIIIVSCGPAAHLQEQKDSVSVIIKESVIYRDSIVYVEVPAETNKAILPDTDTSRLETSIAESEAWIAEGKLSHTLRNKSDMRIPKIVTMPVYLKSRETEHLTRNVTTKEVEVEKELNKWQIFRMMLGTLTLIAAGVWLLLKILKRVLVK